MKLKTIVIVIVSALVLVLLGLAARSVEYIQFNRGCLGYLERASNATSVELAKGELSRAIQYLDLHEINQGYTSLIYRTPDEDVGYWYTNLTTSRAELQALPPDSSSLEKSNMLMKLRETLSDNGEYGNQLICPAGLSVYPYNWLFALWFTNTLGIAALGVLAVAKRIVIAELKASKKSFK